MRAIVAHEFGGPEVLGWEEIETPEPGPGQVRMRIYAVSVNSTLDVQLVAGRSGMRVELPVIPGVDPSGVVDAVGPGVTRLKVGDRVASNAPPPMCGGYAEYIVLDENRPLPIPEGIDFPTATVVRRHFGTARNIMREAKVQPGERVLVMGAAGAVASGLVQFAKEAGATVIAGAGADSRVEAALRIGADSGVNYRRDNLKQQVMALTEDEGVDVVFENVGDPDLWPQAVASLARGGRLLTVGTHGGEGILPLDVRLLYRNRLKVMSGLPLKGYGEDTFTNDIAGVMSGKYRVLIDRILPLSKAREAFEMVGSNSITGKVILDPLMD